ncbi:cyclic nucleotide-binding domain protein (macronuclear) [Tetrahymena thermophila SB210]|uniref:Cyclic nucleotide-binding domain protein n=1 Tax=Tetrahymena thermophila (strain SB210) TaxID=312017 RepID=I7LZM1_TETTS|nr:cyclic nucleotide-binding domain protein [Tetrahymena thermophila SB210]EAR84263.2 cyclic nucleotide-binding domain protein [Tetrahymena thermophila SB210]|eukprot:XP_001031926.2 cyclic nucleotide-binding domain protein [Tetrahymena thermophila SB210]
MNQSKTQNSQQAPITDDEKQKQKKKIVEILKKPPLTRLQSQLVQLQKATENIKFFKELNEKEKDDEIHKQCCQYMMYEQHPKGHPVIVINTVGDKFYIILSGSCSVHIKKNQDDQSEIPELIKVAVMPTGAGFGELALISNKPRMATIICEEDCEFLTLQKRPFDKILKNKNQINSKLAYLESLAFLQEINKGYLRDIYSRSDFKSFVNKQSVFLEGEEADAMYIVTKGTFKAMKKFYVKGPQENDLSQKRLEDQAIEQFRVKEKKLEFKVMQIMTFNQNEYFGEEELIEKKNNFVDNKESSDSSKRSYTVICESVEGELLRIRKQLFRAKVMGDYNGERYMLEHVRQKKNMLKAKCQQVQEQVDKFWKYLKEDRQQLQNNLQLEEESKKRKLIADQFSDSSSFTNLDDHMKAQKPSQRKLLKKGSLNLDNQIVQFMTGNDLLEDKQLTRKGKKDALDKRYSLITSNRELLSQNLMAMIEQHVNQGNNSTKPQSSKNIPVQLNQRKSLANLDSVSQKQFSEGLQKLINQMKDKEVIEEEGNQNQGKSKTSQNFFQEVMITQFINQGQQNQNNQRNSKILDEKNQFLKQLIEKQEAKQVQQPANSQQNSPFKQIKELSLQQQQEILFELFQNHPSQKEQIKQKKYSIASNNENLMQTISSREDKNINLMGLDNRDIPVSKYEMFKDIIKIEEKREFKFTDDTKDDIVTKKQIQKMPYKNYLKEQQEKNQNKLFQSLKKKATKHIKIDASQSKDEHNIVFIEPYKSLNSSPNFKNFPLNNIQENNNQYFFNGNIPHHQSLNQLSPAITPEQLNAPRAQIQSQQDQTRKSISINILQIDPSKKQAGPLSPKIHPSSNKINMIKKNLFETVTQIAKSEQKIKKGTVPLSEDQYYHTKNKSQCELSYPITIRSQAFMTQQQQDDLFGARSQSQHNLISCNSRDNIQSGGNQKHKLQSMQSGIISPIEEECLTSKNIEYNDQNDEQRVNPQQALQHKMSIPSLRFINHENQSPDNHTSLKSIPKFLPTQGDSPQGQRQEYYIGQVNSLPQNNLTKDTKQANQPTTTENLMNQQRNQKHFSLNLRSAGSHRVIRQSQNPSISTPNDQVQNNSRISKLNELSQNTSVSSPIGMQKKNLSLKIINGNSLFNKDKNGGIVSKQVANNFKSANISNQNSNSNDKSLQGQHTPVQEEEREEQTPIANMLYTTPNTFAKTPQNSKFNLNNEISSSSYKANGYGGMLTTNISGDSPQVQQIQYLQRKFTYDSSGKNSKEGGNSSNNNRPTSGNAEIRPYSALNKNKEGTNLFFNFPNANNFVKSSAIKKQKLLSPNSFNSTVSGSPNLNSRKNISIKQIQDLKRKSLQNEIGPIKALCGNGAANHSQSFTNLPQNTNENTVTNSIAHLASHNGHRNSNYQLSNMQYQLNDVNNINDLKTIQQKYNKSDFYQSNHKPLTLFDGFEDIQESVKSQIKPPIQMNKRFQKGFSITHTNNLSHR